VEASLWARLLAGSADLTSLALAVPPDATDVEVDLRDAVSSAWKDLVSEERFIRWSLRHRDADSQLTVGGADDDDVTAGSIYQRSSASE